MRKSKKYKQSPRPKHNKDAAFLSAPNSSYTSYILFFIVSTAASSVGISLKLPNVLIPIVHINTAGYTVYISRAGILPHIVIAHVRADRVVLRHPFAEVGAVEKGLRELCVPPCGIGVNSHVISRARYGVAS